MKTLQRFKKNEVIYPGLIARRGGFNLQNAYKLLKDIEKLNYIEHAFVINCPSCSEEHLYNSVGDVPDEFECSKCGYSNPINVFSDVLIVYKVVCE